MQKYLLKNRVFVDKNKNKSTKRPVGWGGGKKKTLLEIVFVSKRHFYYWIKRTFIKKFSKYLFFHHFSL
jgi:hypothetical protein